MCQWISYIDKSHAQPVEVTTLGIEEMLRIMVESLTGIV
jgi:hypothetical protein